LPSMNHRTSAKNHRRFLAFAFALGFFSLPCRPQTAGKPQMAGMTGDQPAFTDAILQHDISGTDVEPNSVENPMIMVQKGQWTMMFHGAAYLNGEQQSGPRGGDKIFSTNWFMPMAERQIGPGQLTLRAMFSLEPATVTERRYPELFQQGETAFGKPINDGQHPHDFFMEVAALYDLGLGEHALVSLYAAPMGDPAMGPPAYPHRASASEDPLAPLGHHQQDSTHIADEVVTAGFTYRWFRIEGSGFHGREPDEFRWDLDSGKINSWSTRLTAQPGQNWSMQYSLAHLTSPESLHPGEDERRMTASIMFSRHLGRGEWTSMLLWGRNHVLPARENFNSYLAESTLRFAVNERVWTRIENVDRTNELLLGGAAEPAGFEERFLARIQAYSFGYDHEFHFIRGVQTALGGQLTLYGAPAFLDPVYGGHPAGAILFVRVRPTGTGHHHH